MPEFPLVSIILPTFNRAPLIAETIQSVIDQTVKDWELVIIDDGSTDDTQNKVQEFNDDRIQYRAIKHSGVIARVRNEGMKMAKGNYIAFLDSDDLWLTNKLEYQLSLLKKHPLTYFIFGHGEQFGITATPTPNVERFYSGNVFLSFLMEERFIFYVPTLLFKREILTRVKWVNESLLGAGDIDFFLRMAHDFDGIFSNEVVVKIRKHQHSHSDDYELKGYDEYLVMLKKLFSDDLINAGQFKQIESKYHYKLGLLYLCKAKPARAAKEFLHHIEQNPFCWKGWIRFVQSMAKMIIQK